jgi:hypothetical protein
MNGALTTLATGAAQQIVVALFNWTSLSGQQMFIPYHALPRHHIKLDQYKISNNYVL